MPLFLMGPRVHSLAHQAAWCYSLCSSVLMCDVILGHFFEELRAGGKAWGSLNDCDIAVAVVGLEESAHVPLGLFLVCMDLTWMESLSQCSLWLEGPLLCLF